ncbi:DUF4023 domain-containing protein [Metabacillus herbersteinensis]|uniref:DUF4023 domain-containing protein n=1 Tax=Metabacillus herbersteinensis TaxID=283816 RepID=A0ABV6GDZ2_9BACI
MDSTNKFVEKLHVKQDKAEKNKRTQGNGNPGKKLPNKVHK